MSEPLHREWAIQITEPSGSFSTEGKLVKRLTEQRFTSLEAAKVEVEWLRAWRDYGAKRLAAAENLNVTNEWHLALARLARTTYALVSRVCSPWTEDSC